MGGGARHLGDLRPVRFRECCAHQCWNQAEPGSYFCRPCLLRWGMASPYIRRAPLDDA